MLIRKRLLLFNRGPEINLTCPVIVPETVTELVTNGTMELDANWANTGSPTTNERSSEQAHGGTYSRKVVSTGVTTDGIKQTLVPVTGTWYLLSAWRYGDGVRNVFMDWDSVTTNLGNAAAWGQSTRVRRKQGGAALLEIYCSDASTWYIDDVSVLSLSNIFAYVGTLGRQTGTWNCRPTVATNRHAGFAINWRNSSNFVLAYVNLVDNKAYLDKCVGGTYSNVVNGAITYGATNILKVIVSGTNYGLYYNGAQVGATTAITDTMGYDVYGFSTDSSNLVGLVTTSPATS